MNNDKSIIVWKTVSVLVLMLGISAEDGRAQLISPGELIEGHATWDAIDTCISCHKLGVRGADDNLCLTCHTPLKNSLDLEEGLHSTFTEPSCASCHKDHFGRDFDPIRFDTLNFEHDLTGYELLQSHETASCINCHTTEYIADSDLIAFNQLHSAQKLTFLGLDQVCEGCHRPDNVHDEQFTSDTCESCHDQDEWETAVLFDHDSAEYKLDGAHLNVECASCHSKDKTDPELIVYRPLPFDDCASCHEDVHEPSMAPTCNTCHSTSDWSSMVASDFEDSFNHDATEFPLLGLHVAATCESCHSNSEIRADLSITFLPSTRTRTYPLPISSSCESCHEDIHLGSLAENASCESCHSEQGWTPSEFDVFRHNEESSFSLEGAHMAVLCSQCHVTKPGSEDFDLLSFSVEDQTCVGCHAEDSPHDAQFELTSCNSCHFEDAWEDVVPHFDHDTTDFPLIGAHTLSACSSCHTPDEQGFVRYRQTDKTCESCHQNESPHDGQFDPVTCNDCHDEISFLLASFNHDTTPWPLEGAHVDVACADCHYSLESAIGEPVVQYRGIGTACIDCHGGER